MPNSKQVAGPTGLGMTRYRQPAAGLATSRRARYATAALAVLAIGLGAAALYAAVAFPSAQARADFRDEVLVSARTSLVDLTSFSYRTLDEDIARIRAVTTEEFQQEAVDRIEDQRAEVTQAEVSAASEVAAAGITVMNADEATVIALLRTATTAGTAEAAPDQIPDQIFRVTLVLTRTGDRWLVSEIGGV